MSDQPCPVRRPLDRRSRVQRGAAPAADARASARVPLGAAAALRDRRRRRRLEGQHCEVVEAAMATHPEPAPRAPDAEPRQGRGGPPRHARGARPDPRDVRRRRLDAARGAAEAARADHRLQSGDRDRLALRRGREDRRQAAVLSRAVEPPVQQGHPALARPGRARHAVRLQGVHRRGGARPVPLRAAIDGWAFDLEILALARRRGFAIAEVGVEWKDDGRSRVNPLKDMWKVIREALTIRRNLAPRRLRDVEVASPAEPLSVTRGVSHP